ncbi:N-acetyl-1-D-myo-inositol-2-amino-2-deoxy-alpha-D-glucopyranoside deacetylase [Saccharothrix coeruleofusca]|uniref:1D-myo-inositol 2-acetamido-2-deoxy-alpha-D-glucopyranoside deacetylase n=1 Tax=Saccharothrix coeruleofusca TaxID=33919 RepID=A0A918AN73_9PSEU|nr:N-acetyl-1-D-myo-inositol-2-amino-2-deoxy-alpha-D-glucopyranoside deacetylase [Saccharothrix coeruleofusca]MBP2340891.1 N-acetyl-1-D-myo-inositol-2-amino-2-deoxy-alpha-D-glucopyranoside deacetylase [Saccharothrix coeruleofusca]GGP60615.1 1D-myo-inositol 2-acetamido-2-deoxy-alpha-D-glucopyranoside deacetylase [Saccharothrix coeruleofusca]
MTLTAPPRLLLVHAHPDDESLWTGGTIARYAASGAHVTVVTCTLGEEGEIIPPALRQLAADAADQLGGYRVAELRAACTALGVTDHRFLGGMGRWRDSGMAGVAANEHPRAFVQGSFDEQVEELSGIIASVKPQVVVTYDAFGGYGHPDHIRAHQITTAACAATSEVDRVFHAVTSRAATEAGAAALAELPDLPFRLPEPGELPVTDDAEITTTVDVSEHLVAKLRALRAHSTQVSVWQDGAGSASYALSNGIAQPVVPTEHYVLAKGSAEGAETDLFGGLDDR